MLPLKKPKIALLSLRNSYGYGGVLSSLQAMYDFCLKYFDPTVFFLGFDSEIAASLRHFKVTSSCRFITYFGMRCVEVGARWAFWEPGHYAYTMDLWEKLFKDYDYFVVASGTCIVAHPFALLNKKYGLLISTSYTEDRRQRVESMNYFRLFIDRCAQRSMLKIEKNILQKAGCIWALSNYSIEKFRAITAPINPVTIHCGHPIDCTNLPELSHKKKNSLLALGRFSDPRKNLDMLLRVFEKIYRKNHDATLCVVGHKPTLNQLKPFLSSPSFAHVIFAGQVEQKELIHVLSITSLMLITSYQEGFCIAGLEALLHGIPIISTRCGGPQDYVIDHLTGFQVNINDDNAMADYAYSILNDPTKHSVMAHNAQQFAAENYSTEHVYSLFRQGFIGMYPELKEWFTYCGDIVTAIPPIEKMYPHLQQSADESSYH